MFSSTIKRSVATLGVVAGFLAAAGPASAQVGPSISGLTTPHTGPGPQIATSDVFELNTFGGNDTLRADSNEVAVEGITLGVVTNNNDPDTMGLTLRDPAHPVTMLDYEGNTPMDEVVFSATSNRTDPRSSTTRSGITATATI